jgi:hypothetical protein
MRNGCKEFGLPVGGFKPHTNLFKGTNDEIISNEEDIKNRRKPYFQDLINAAADERNTSLDNPQTNEIETEQELESDPDILDKNSNTITEKQ